MTKMRLAILLYVYMVCILISIALSFRASGAELTQDQGTLIYALAHSVSGYPLAERPPKIKLVPVAELRKAACPSNPVCDVHGMQIADTVYLDDALDMADPYNGTILLHEMVHFLQWSKYGPAKDCLEWLQREMEAYGLQNHVLQKIGLRLVRPIMPMCS